MLQFSKVQAGFIGFIILLGAYFAAPNFVPEGQKIPGLPGTAITLGLDLQGGSYLLLEVDTDDVLEKRLLNVEGEVRTALRGGAIGERKEQIRFNGLDKRGDSVFVTILKPEQFELAEKRLKALGSPIGQFGTGGVDLVVTNEGEGRFAISLSEEGQKFYSEKAVSDSIEVVRRRIDALGNKEASISRTGDNRLVVQVPGDEDSEGLKSVIKQKGQLTFNMVDDTVDLARAVEGLVPPRKLLLTSKDGYSAYYVVNEIPDVTGDMIVKADSAPNNQEGGFQVNITFDGRGTKRFAHITANNLGKQFAIVLDDEVVSAPVIRSIINQPNMRITGNFTAQEALELAILIRAGALPAPLQVIEQRTVGAELGADSIRAGTLALMVGFAGVILFMLFVYRRFGIYANIALIANVVLIGGALSLLGSTLTLPGIAGIVLTIGMAVDANVLIFERIREELMEGKKVIQAVEAGYNKAFSAIIDANITTFLACIIMFYLGTGPVRGFALTLGVGVITSVFTAYVLSRVFVGGYVLANRPKTLPL